MFGNISLCIAKLLCLHANIISLLIIHNYIRAVFRGGRGDISVGEVEIQTAI